MVNNAPMLPAIFLPYNREWKNPDKRKTVNSNLYNLNSTSGQTDDVDVSHLCCCLLYLTDTSLCEK